MGSFKIENKFECMLPETGAIEELIKFYLKCDCPSFDVGGFVVGNSHQVAHLLAKSAGKISGVVFADKVFKLLGLETEWFRTDGDIVSEEEAKKKLKICVVKGAARNILLAERTALNILSRASGVATLSSKYVDICKEALPNWKGNVAATRKTTPGFGLIEKYSLIVGGCATHRIDLSQMTMLKDNHVDIMNKSLTEVVAKARLVSGFSSKIEVECRSFEEAVEAVQAGAEIIMLDNFGPEDMKAAARKLKLQFKDCNFVIEASGGITEESIRDFVDDSIDVISVGKLTQGYPCLDFSLKIQKIK